MRTSVLNAMRYRHRSCLPGTFVDVDGVEGETTENPRSTTAAEGWPWMGRLENVAGLMFVLAGAGLVLIRWIGSDPGLPNAEIAALAVGAPYSALGLLAVLGGRSSRPALMVTAGASLAYMCMASVLTILLMPFALFLFVRGAVGLGTGRQRHLGWEELCLSSVLPAAPLLAFGYLLFHEDPASWQPDEYSYHSTSDIVTVTESVLSLGAVTMAVVVSIVWIVIEPASKRGPPGP